MPQGTASTLLEQFLFYNTSLKKISPLKNDDTRNNVLVPVEVLEIELRPVNHLTLLRETQLHMVKNYVNALLSRRSYD